MGHRDSGGVVVSQCSHSRSCLGSGQTLFFAERPRVQIAERVTLQLLWKALAHGRVGRIHVHGQDGLPSVVRVDVDAVYARHFEQFGGMPLLEGLDFVESGHGTVFRTEEISSLLSQAYLGLGLETQGTGLELGLVAPGLTRFPDPAGSLPPVNILASILQGSRGGRDYRPRNLPARFARVLPPRREETAATYTKTF
jgi:hypothetical protein